jgi:hypothetical protein
MKRMPATAEEEKAASAAFEFEQNKAKMILWRAGRQSCVFMFGNALAGIFYSQLPLTMLLSRFSLLSAANSFAKKSRFFLKETKNKDGPPGFKP